MAGDLHEISANIGELRGKLDGMSGWMRRIEGEGKETARLVQEIHVTLKALPQQLEAMNARITAAEANAASAKAIATASARRDQRKITIAIAGGGVGGGGMVALFVQFWDIIKPFLFKAGS